MSGAFTPRNEHGSGERRRTAQAGGRERHARECVRDGIQSSGGESYGLRASANAEEIPTQAAIAILQLTSV